MENDRQLLTKGWKKSRIYAGFYMRDKIISIENFHCLIELLIYNFGITLSDFDICVTH